jgi:ribonuclease P protein component
MRMQADTARFPKAARLLKTDEFSSVFRLRPWSRSAHFVLYGRPTGKPARLGLVIAKKFAPRSVTRNLLRRLAREAFRLNRAELDGFDILLRLHAKFDRKAWPSGASGALRSVCRAEIDQLIGRAREQAAKLTVKQATQDPAKAPPDA